LGSAYLFPRINQGQLLELISLPLESRECFIVGNFKKLQGRSGSGKTPNSVHTTVGFGLHALLPATFSLHFPRPIERQWDGVEWAGWMDGGMIVGMGCGVRWVE